MSTRRKLQVRELLNRHLSEILRRETPTETIGVLTINDIGLADDLHSATVYIGVFGNKANRASAEQFLKDKRGYLQTLLAKSVQLRYTPVLRFVVNDSIERGNRVIELLNQLPELPTGDEEDPQGH